MGNPPGDVLSTIVHNDSRLHGIGYVDENIIASLGSRLIDHHVGEQGLSSQDLRGKIDPSHHSIRGQIHNQDLWRAGDLVILQGSRNSGIQQPNAIAGIKTKAINRSQDEIAAVEVTATSVGKGPIRIGLQSGGIPELGFGNPTYCRGNSRKELWSGQKDPVIRNGYPGDQNILRIVEVRIVHGRLGLEVIAQEFPLLGHLQARS